ncbi:MAG: hypothetical protein LH609_20205 [Rudanella sp.]|nr:hypothetical protein [Rudanella sp.]
MTFSDIKTSLTALEPPTNLSPIAEALWHDAKGDWERAHNVAQSREGIRDYDRLHAYLHRKEGDTRNAGYWYCQAKAEVFAGTLDEEWEALVQDFLA